MVDSISELSDLSRKLNQKSDQTNSIVTNINKKLAALNLGVEVWLDQYERDELKADNYRKVYAGQLDPLSREKEVIYLGYSNVEDQWQLAVKEGTLVESFDQDNHENTLELIDVGRRPLLKASRRVRVKALPLVPRLLDLIKLEASKMLEQIEAAEKAAEKL